LIDFAGEHFGFRCETSDGVGVIHQRTLHYRDDVELCVYEGVARDEDVDVGGGVGVKYWKRVVPLSSDGEVGGGDSGKGGG
jgi:hypothetical protein